MKFKFPKTMPENATELATLRAEAVEAFNELYADGKEVSAESFEQLQYITEGVKDIDGRLTELSAADDRLASAAELASQLADKSNDDDAEDDVDDADEEDKGDEVEDADDDEEEEVEEEDKQDYSDKTKKTDFSAAARRNKKRDLPKNENGFRLTTSAKNFETGIVDTFRVAQEFGNLAQGRAARVVGQGGKSSTTVAYVERRVPDEFSIGSEAEAISVLDRTTNEARLPGGSLVAAGGWVSPSETMYDFLPTIAAGDLLSVPELTIRRGGVKFPVEPDFSAIYANTGFHQTEAQAIAGEEKPCFEIPDAEFAEVRLDVVGLCISAGILQDKAWPELTQKYVSEALRAHQHRINAYRINQIVEGSDNVGTLTGVQFGAVGAVLNAVELQIQDIRAKHRLPSTQSMEGFAPVWTLAILRADLAYRQGVLPENVTDEQLRSHFRERGANLQFVADWQNEVIGGETSATDWPDTVDIVFYPSGTWWSAVEPVINLGITHDSTLLKQNRQIQMFTEDGIAIGKRGPESRLVSIPINVNGTVGARYAEAVNAG